MSASEPTGFRRWRRTRPFWGGLFTMLAGAEIILIPLAPAAVTVHQGIAGVASWLAGLLLIVSGGFMWFQPQQRSFFGILAVLLSLVSFVTSNLGGFLFGMILGLVGGALGFAWAPRRPKPEPAEPPADTTEPDHAPPDHEPAQDTPGYDTPVAGHNTPTTQYDVPVAGHDVPAAGRHAGYGSGEGESPGRSSISKFMGLALVPALLSTGLLGVPQERAATTCNWFTSIFGCQDPKPSPAPSGKPTPSPTTTSTTTPPGSTPPDKPSKTKPGDKDKCGKGRSLLPKPGTGKPSCEDDKKCPKPDATAGSSPKKIVEQMAAAAPCAKPGKAKKAPAGQAPINTDPATLTASSLTMSGLHYDGVVSLPTKDGPVKRLRFSMKRAVLNNVDQKVGKGTLTGRLRVGTLTFSGGVVMYAAKMKSNVLGLLPLTFTPEHPPPLVLPTMFMTDVVTEQSNVQAASATLTGLKITV